jgi:hypothetical protein
MCLGALVLGSVTGIEAAVPLLSFEVHPAVSMAPAAGAGAARGAAIQSRPDGVVLHYLGCDVRIDDPSTPFRLMTRTS